MCNNIEQRVLQLKTSYFPGFTTSIIVIGILLIPSDNFEREVHLKCGTVYVDIEHSNHSIQFIAVYLTIVGVNGG
jgi:hypothetical protein